MLLRKILQSLLLVICDVQLGVSLTRSVPSSDESFGRPHSLFENVDPYKELNRIHLVSDRLGGAKRSWSDELLKFTRLSASISATPSSEARVRTAQLLSGFRPVATR